MTIYNPEGTHETYTRVDRHWCRASEQYTGADSLLTAQRNGWQLIGVAYREVFALRGGRYIHVYHFDLCRRDHTMRMPIIENPFVLRLIDNQAIDVLPYGDAPPMKTSVRDTNTMPAVEQA